MKCVKSQRQEGSYSASTDLANQELKLREGYNGIKVPNLKLYWGGLVPNQIFFRDIHI